MPRFHQISAGHPLGEQPRGDAFFFACGATHWRKQGIALAMSFDTAYESIENRPTLHAHVVNPTDDDMARLTLFNRIITSRFTFTIEYTELDTLEPAAVAGYLDRIRFRTAAALFREDARLLLIDANVLIHQPIGLPSAPIATMSLAANDLAQASARALLIGPGGRPVLERVRDVLCEDNLQPGKNDSALRKVVRENQNQVHDWATLNAEFLVWPSPDRIAGKAVQQRDLPTESQFNAHRNALLRRCDWSAL